MAGAMASGILLDFEFGDTAITTLSFIRDVVVDAKHYGDQVPAVRARLSYDIARINSFVEFLRRRAPDGEPQLGKLQDASQNAVIGLIQELEFTLAGFTAYVNKHDIVDLRRGYVKSTRGVLEGDALASRVAEAEGILSTADVKQKLRWGIFEKSRIMTILRDLEDWGDRAMNLLLCVVSFHSGVEGKNAATLTDS